MTWAGWNPVEDAQPSRGQPEAPTDVQPQGGTLRRTLEGTGFPG
jgi:hypothetical protein